MATRKPAAKKAVPVKKPVAAKKVPAAKKTVVRRGRRPRIAVEVPVTEEAVIQQETVARMDTEASSPTGEQSFNPGAAMQAALKDALLNAFKEAPEQDRFADAKFVDLGEAPLHIRAMFLNDMAERGYLYNGHRKPLLHVHDLEENFFEVVVSNKIIRAADRSNAVEGGVVKLLAAMIEDVEFVFSEATPATPLEQVINGVKYVRQS